MRYRNLTTFLVTLAFTALAFLGAANAADKKVIVTNPSTAPVPVEVVSTADHSLELGVNYIHVSKELILGSSQHYQKVTLDIPVTGPYWIHNATISVLVDEPGAICRAHAWIVDLDDEGNTFDNHLFKAHATEFAPSTLSVAYSRPFMIEEQDDVIVVIDNMVTLDGCVGFVTVGIEYPEAVP